MDNYRLQLEETQDKLTNLTEQLDSVLKCNCKLGVGMDYVIATVHELKSLMEWTAEKSKADVIVQKLQQLERIQKDLEKTATESEEIRLRLSPDNNLCDTTMHQLESKDDVLLIDLSTPDAEPNAHDSLGPNISEDEGLGDSTGPSSFVSDQRQEWNDSKSSLDMCANLRESSKELSAIQNDQKQIAELHDIILNLHHESVNLKAELEKVQKDNCTYKEQVLELEEAENDARLQSQKLSEKLLFLQEKDTHFQAKLSETEQALENCLKQLNLKELEHQELRSQVKYLDILVQKYEEQIKTMEIVTQRLIEDEAMEKSIARKIDKGTQMYEPISSKCDDINIANKFVNEENKSYFIESSAQTEDFEINILPPAEFKDVSESDPITGASKRDESTLFEIPCPIQKELLKRLHQLVEEDAYLQQQLHYVDQINLTLWKKLHNLEFHIGECKRKNLSEDNASDSCIESEGDCFSRPVSRQQMHDDSPCYSKTILSNLNRNEIKLRLFQLEEINSAFEKELEVREKFYMERERNYGEWVQTEQRFIGDLKRLSDERDSLKVQVAELELEKQELSTRVLKLEEEMKKTNEKHQLQIKHLKDEQDKSIVRLQLKVSQLLVKEKEHLKQILKISDKTESDQLKSSYVELQLELSRTRDEMRKKEEEFRTKLEEIRSKHMLEETRMISELEMVRQKNTSCDKMISNYQTRETELIEMVKQKEQVLEQARQEYKKNVEATEDEHRAIEAELKKQLRQMEEGTSVATKALSEEKMRLEKELQNNIDDLRGKEEGYKARIAELENNVTHLHEELHRLTGDIDSDVNRNGISNFRREKLMNQLKELRVREVELREKLDEMEQKEAAYRETLEHADRIVASVEQGYKHKIEELEISERNLKQRVGHLEEIESRLRGALHKERRSSDGRRPDDLVVELLEAEARENTLKEKIEQLELTQRHAANKVKDLEKLREKLESQLNDEEELASHFHKAQQELDTSRKTLAKLRKSESDLKSSLQQTENVLNTREAQMQSIEDEKNGLEETIRELRAQVRELKTKLEKVSELSLTQQSQNNEDEPDYVDVEDFPVQAPKVRPNSYTFGRGSIKSPVPGSYASKKLANHQKDDRLKQLSAPNIQDTYDAARQNLEDCMMRAMAAMKNDIRKKVPIVQTAADENDYNEILPRPTNFRVVQQVGSDTLLVGWDYVNSSILEGFEVYLNGQLLESVYTPDRSKALISGLDLKHPIHLSISAFSKYGQMSEPAAFQLMPARNEDENDEISEDSMYEKHRPYSMDW